MGKFRIICVDDDDDILGSVCYCCGRTSDLECVGSYRSTEGLGEAITRLKPDVLLLDLNIPGENTLGVLRTLKAADPGLRCLMWSGYDDAGTMQAAVNAGATGCIAKDLEMDLVLNAVRSLCVAEKKAPVADGAGPRPAVETRKPPAVGQRASESSLGAGVDPRRGGF